MLSTLCLCVLGLSRDLEVRIEELVASNPRQMSVREYSEIAEVILKSSSVNLLVFGCGRDSQLWTSLNKGRTVFLEDNLEWIRKTRSQIPGVEIHHLTYGTKPSEATMLLKNQDKLKWKLPGDLESVSWDIVVIDAPIGNKVGRMKSIWKAAQVAKPGMFVFVHDTDRQIEQTYCDEFLKPSNLIDSYDRTRVYRMK